MQFDNAVQDTVRYPAWVSTGLRAARLFLLVMAVSRRSAFE
jgi:hypothetical protein